MARTTPTPTGSVVAVAGVAGGLLLAATLAGCGASDATDATSAAPAPSSSSTSAAPVTSSTGAPRTSAATGSGAAGGTVSVTESEYAISMGPSSFKAGTYTFTVKNVGTIAHALTIDGPGVEDQTTGVISPGGSADVSVTLRAGTYDFYCPVGDHQMEGMDQKVTVA